MSDPTGVNVEYEQYQFKGAEILGTYCEVNPTGCCAGEGCGVGTPAGPDNTLPIIGWCVEYTVIQVPASMVELVKQYCVPNPTDCCAGSGGRWKHGSGSGTSINLTNGQGSGRRYHHRHTHWPERFKKTKLQLPPGPRSSINTASSSPTTAAAAGAGDLAVAALAGAAASSRTCTSASSPLRCPPAPAVR